MQDYTIGFRIFEAQSLQTEDNLPCDPFVIVECAENTYQTETLEGRNSLAPWNESHTWTGISMHSQEFESEFIEFRVYARHWFTRNYLIGKTSLQLSYINKRQSHLYAKRWLPLRREDSPAITGMLNVTVYVLKPGEQAPSMTMQMSEQRTSQDDGGEIEQKKDEGKDNELQSAVLNTSVEPSLGQPHYVRLNIHRVQDLEEGSSPYVTCEFGGCLLTTSTGKNVAQYTFNECLQIPVVTPVYEDTIILKLWQNNWFSPDQLMAQGLLSFSELRANALVPRWFNLYAWEDSEVDQINAMTGNSKAPDPNIYKGRLLISGYVLRLDAGQELQKAMVTPAPTIAEPQMVPLAIVADVHMVNGADGRQCQVEVSFGRAKDCTQWVSYDSEPLDDPAKGQEDTGDLKGATAVETNSFTFTQKAGRIPLMPVTAPENQDSQPMLMVSVYTQGYLQSVTRVAFAKIRLSDFPEYDPGNPGKPVFLALERIGQGVAHRASISCLVSIGHTRKVTVQRSMRKEVKPMVYALRAYCFMARNITYPGKRNDTEASDLSLTVSCAGTANSTKPFKGPRPAWMEMLELRTILCSVSSLEVPLAEPITVTLSESGQMVTADIGKAVCQYTQMRKKDAKGKWEHFRLLPQWVQVFGGNTGNLVVGEICIAFEMILYRSRAEAQVKPLDMWPQLEEEYDPRKHISKLKKATLHFSLLGLRDVQPLPRIESLGFAGGSVHVAKPIVTVEVHSHLNPEARQALNEADAQNVRVQREGEVEETKDGSLKEAPMNTLQFEFGERENLEQGHKKKWPTTIRVGSIQAMNFEFLYSGKMKCLIPDNPALNSHIAVKVHETPSSLGASVGYTPTPIGETLLPLENLHPCIWLDGVNLEQSFESQKELIEEQLRKVAAKSRARESFQEPTLAELAPKVDSGMLEIEAQSPENAENEEGDEEPFLDEAGLAKPLRKADVARRPVPHMASSRLNFRRVSVFSPRQGRELNSAGGARTHVEGKLEMASHFKQDFLYRGYPLRRNQAHCKLLDGWDDDAVAKDDGEDVEAEDDDTHKLNKSFLATHELRELDRIAFDEEELFHKYKDPELMPPAIRVRMYFVKAVCMCNDSANPYLDLMFGNDIAISMRNMARPSTNTPEFFRVEERDIKLPEQARLEVTLKSMEELALQDTVIGGTVIDLEDRWHSIGWQRHNKLSSVPIENRSLADAVDPEKTRGSLEMWIEMVAASEAADVKAAALVRPPDVELELRLVIWGTTGVKLMAKDHTNVKVSTSLNCKEYVGMYDARQETDVHYHSTDGKAVFNWRMVYPRICMPTASCTLQVDLWHSEMTGDDFIGNLQLDLKKYVERVARDLDALTIGPNKVTVQNEEEPLGTIEMSVYVMTQSQADGRRVGIARDDPNEDPQLITPTEGRDWGTFLEALGFGWPDFGLWKKLMPLLVVAAVFLVAVIAMKQIGLL
eukprot:TRINITY_DN9037_c0_g1_i2.p1 TRINITY_DN9037_c0_g1~~TRINITY_DN9037_c0_g1_i2.p1  ORF type:complete len:1451 (+),score=280.29 TRINITY_DN9037_c0_g1_i2:132-4484(+)